MRQLGFDRSLHRIVTFAVHCSHLEAYIRRSKNLLYDQFPCVPRVAPSGGKSLTVHNAACLFSLLVWLYPVASFCHVHLRHMVGGW